MSQQRERRLAKRVLAGIGVAALTLLGTVSVSTAASALTINNIDPDATTSLTIHKHAGTPGTAGDGTVITDQAAIDALGEGLAGVQFSVERVTHDEVPIDLTTAAGWDLAQDATVANVNSGADDFGKVSYATNVTTLTGGVATLSNIPKGLYLVTETSPGAHPIVSPVEPFLVSVPYPAEATSTWIYEVHVYPKNKLNETVPTKTVAEPGTVTLGSSVVWTVTAPIPELAAGDTYRSFVITDDLDPRLTLTGTVVKIDGGEPLVPGAEGDYVQTGNTVITFTATGLGKLAGKSNVTVDLTTTVDSLASDDLEPGKIPNEAVVQVNGSEVTTDPAQTNWGPLQIKKVAAESPNRPLDGATFTLHKTKGGPALTPPGELTSADGGMITVEGLWVGNGETLSTTYWVQEIAAPPGYTLPTGDDAWTEITVTAGALADVETEQISNTQQGGPNLPLTGSAGTLLFMGGGLGLVLLAVGATMMASRKKQHDVANTVE